MRIIVSEIPEEGLDLELEESLVSDAVRILSPVSAGLRVEKIEDEVYIRGSLKGDVELQCSRCLNVFPHHVASPVNVVFLPARETREADHRELKGEELDTDFYEHDEIDTDHLLLDQLLLNVPMKPLCSADCKGLCPRCGTDINTGPCGCPANEADSRFSVLEQLLKKKE